MYRSTEYFSNAKGLVRFSLLAIFLMTCFAAPVSAYSMRCKLLGAKSVADNGMLEEHVLLELLVEDEIILDRQTGKVFHPEFGNESYEYREILDSGSSQSSFKVIAYSKLSSPRMSGENGFRNFTMFTVSDFAEGHEKPFLAISGGLSMGYGVCK